MQSIELLLNDATEAAVRLEWNRLHDVGLHSLARHTGDSNRPHITLLVAKRVTTSGADAPLSDFAVHDERRALDDIRAEFRSLPLPLTIGGLVVFGTGRHGFVLARHVVVTDALLALHRRVHTAANPVATSIVDLSRPDSWTPHITLARRLSAAEMGAAIEAIGATPFESGAATAARLWDGDAKTITPLT